jgi:hypothetical protein
MAKGRRALLIAGGGHLLRGLYSDRNLVNVSTPLEQRYPGSVYIVDTLAQWPGTQRDAAGRRLAAAIRG